MILTKYPPQMTKRLIKRNNSNQTSDTSQYIQLQQRPSFDAFITLQGGEYTNQIDSFRHISTESKYPPSKHSSDKISTYENEYTTYNNMLLLTARRKSMRNTNYTYHINHRHFSLSPISYQINGTIPTIKKKKPFLYKLIAMKHKSNIPHQLIEHRPPAFYKVKKALGFDIYRVKRKKGPSELSLHNNSLENDISKEIYERRYTIYINNHNILNNAKSFLQRNQHLLEDTEKQKVMNVIHGYETIIRNEEY